MTVASGVIVGLGTLAGVAFGLWSLLIFMPVVAGLEVLQARRRWRVVAIAVLAIGVGTLRGAVTQEPADMPELAASRASHGEIVSMPVASGQSERVIVRIDRLEHESGVWKEIHGRVLVYLPAGGPDVNLGDQVSLVWSATPRGDVSPGYASYLESQGVAGSARAWNVRIDERGSGWMRRLTDARRAIGDVLQDAIPGDAGALAAGIVTGDDSALSDEARSWFRHTGTTQVTAVSGQNVALLVGFLAIWLPPGRRSTRWLAQGSMFLAIWLYVGMVGLEPPALRAAIVASLMMLGSWFGRRPDPITILSLTLGAMALVEPAMTRQVGFLLSAAASWALCASISTHERPTVLGGLVDMFKAVMAANIATLPIILWTFGEWSPISLLANVLLGPVMTIAFPASYVLVAIGVVLPGVMPWLAWIPAIPLDISLVIVRRLSSVLPLVHLPVAGASMVLLVAVPCFGTLFVMSRDGRRWLRRFHHEWTMPGSRIHPLFAGAMTAGIVVLASMVMLWR